MTTWACMNYLRKSSRKTHFAWKRSTTSSWRLLRQTIPWKGYWREWKKQIRCARSKKGIPMLEKFTWGDWIAKTMGVSSNSKESMELFSSSSPMICIFQRNSLSLASAKDSSLSLGLFVRLPYLSLKLFYFILLIDLFYHCRIFSLEVACDVIKVERHSYVFYKAKLDIWIVTVWSPVSPLFLFILKSQWLELCIHLIWGCFLVGGRQKQWFITYMESWCIKKCSQGNSLIFCHVSWIY